MEKRTTVVADADDLAVVAEQARRDGVSLGAALGELVAARAATLRLQRRPRVALFRSGGGSAAARETDEYLPEPFRS